MLDAACGPESDPVIIPSVLVSAVGAVAVLAATRKGRVLPGTHAHVAMLVAWMPNAAFWLLTTLVDKSPFLPSRSVGYYLAIVTFVAYAVEATLRVRRALRTEGEPEAEAPPS
ncbi:MAG: hypothetical protein ACYTKD_28365 [Planctomycetota bacterium]|jgi:hypothetical protein